MPKTVTSEYTSQHYKSDAGFKPNRLSIVNKLSDSVSISKSKVNKKTLDVKSKRACKRYRSRKDYDQMVLLNQMFKNDPTWSRATVQYLKGKLGLKTSQIYKWGYDRKKIAEKEQSILESSKEVDLWTNDSYLTDDSILNYNEAVSQICDSAWISDKFGHHSNSPTSNVSDVHLSKSWKYSNNFTPNLNFRSEICAIKSENRTSYDNRQAWPVVHTCGWKSYKCSETYPISLSHISNQTTLGHNDKPSQFCNIRLAPTPQTFIFEYDDNLMEESNWIKPLEAWENRTFLHYFDEIPIQAPLIDIADDFSASIDLDIW